MAWLNTFFKFNFEKIEQVCTGAAHCQIMDALFPGQIQLNKVNFYARFDYEYIKNYKLLQGVFNKLNISKVIDVNKLIKGKYQDNLEFLQWMKRFFDTHWDGSSYDALGRRLQAIKDYDGKWTNKATSNSNISVLTGAPLSSNNNNMSGIATSAPVLRRTGTTASVTASSVSRGPTYSRPNRPASQQPTDEMMNSRIRQLGLQNTELKQEVTNLEKERDFYFQKLRDIEVMCEEYAHNSATQSIPEAVNIVEQIKKILYATDEDFVSVEEPITSSQVEPLSDQMVEE